MKEKDQFRVEVPKEPYAYYESGIAKETENSEKNLSAQDDLPSIEDTYIKIPAEK